MKWERTAKLQETKKLDAGAQEFVPGAAAAGVPSKDMDARAPEFVPQGIKAPRAQFIAEGLPLQSFHELSVFSSRSQANVSSFGGRNSSQEGIRSLLGGCYRENTQENTEKKKTFLAIAIRFR